MYAIRDKKPEVRSCRTNQKTKKKAFECNKCRQKLKLAQIQRKSVNLFTDFAVLVYYCWKCKLTYFDFKLITKNKNEKVLCNG